MQIIMILDTPESVTLYSPPSGQAGQLATVQCVSEPGYPEPHIFFEFSQVNKKYIELRGKSSKIIKLKKIKLAR